MIPGVYVFRWTITNGVCATSTDDVQITIYAIPITSNAGADQNLCDVTSTMLAGNSPGAGTGTWTLISGPNAPTITTPSSDTSTVTGMIAGVYDFKWTITNGVCSASNDTVQITIYALPTTSNAGPVQNLCNVTSTLLAGNTPGTGTGTWTLISGPNSPTISSPSSATSIVTGMIAGVYDFKWTITSGVCATSSDSVQITIYALPTTSNAGADQNWCNVTSITFAGNSPTTGTGAWAIISGPNSPTITSPSSATSTVTGMIAGIYTFSWTITNGVCASSTDSVEITINSIPSVANAGPDQDLCNTTSTTLAGNSPATGTGTWTLVSGPNSPTITTPSNPLSTITGMIAGVYVFTWTVTNGVCVQTTDNVQITINTLPTTSNAGVNQNLCNVTMTSLSGNVPSSGTGLWSLVSGPNTPSIFAPASATTSVTGMIAGIYTFSWTISNGVCGSSADTIKVTIYALPTVSNAGPDQNICNIDSVTLAGNSPAIGTGAWSLVSGPNAPTISSPSSPGSTVTGMIPGVYIFRWTITSGVCATSANDVQVTIYALPTISNAGPDQNFCNVTSSTFAGNSPTDGTGVWSLVSGPNVPTITTPSNASSTITGMTAGVYVFRWTISNGVCSNSTDDVQITIYDLPSSADAGPDQDLCSVTSILLTGNAPVTGSGLWSMISGPNAPSILTPSNNSTSVTGMIPGIYIFRWTISNGVCADSSDNVQVTIYSTAVTVDAGPDQNLCNIDSVVMAGNSPSSGTGTWTLINGPNSPVITSLNDSATSITGLIAGTYLFGWTIVNGACTSPTDTIQVNLYDLPSISNAGPDQDVCSVTSVSLSGNNPVTGNGTWTFISGPNTPVITDTSAYNSSVTGMIAGTYIFQWTISNGVCASSRDSVTVKIYSIPLFIDAGSDQNLCNIDSAVMNGNIPSVGTGTWSLLSGPNVPSITSVNNPQTSITGMIAGTYLFGWVIDNGVCSSRTDTVQVIIYDLPTIADAGTDSSLCNVTGINLYGNSPITGNGMWTQISGPNSPVITDSTVYNSSVTGMIAGSYLFQWTISNGVCSSSIDSVAITIYDLATIADAGPDQVLCADTMITMAANVPSTGTGMWTLISGPNSPVITTSNDPATTVTGLIAGTYLFSWTISNGVCSPSSDTVSIIIYDIPTTSDAGPDQFICNDSVTVLSGNIAVTGFGNWMMMSGPNAAVITSPSIENSGVTGMIPGVYTFRWSINNGVCPVSDDDVQVTIYALPTTADAGPDQDQCGDTTAILTGNNPAVGTGVWTQVSGPNTGNIISATSPATSVDGLMPGTYLFSWTTSNGNCVSSADTIQVAIFGIPNFSDAGPDQNLCNDSVVTLAGNTPSSGTGTWTMLSGPNTPAITDSSMESTTVTGLIAGTYIFRWTINNFVCTPVTDDVQIIIYSLPTVADAGPDQNLCNAFNPSMSANTAATGTGLWSQISGPNSVTFVSPNNEITSVTGLVAGVYSFMWTISNGVCTSTTDTVQVTIDSPPTASDAGPDQNLCNDSTITLTGNVPSTGTGNWMLVSGPNTPAISSVNSPVTTVAGMIPGTYNFEWITSNGICAVSTDTTQVIIYTPSQAADAGTDQSLCNSASISLTGNTPSIGTGSWGIISGPNVPVINSPASASTTVSNCISGTYIFSWSITNGVCPATSDSVQVILYGLIDTSNAGPDTSLCDATSIILNGNTPVIGAGLWSEVSGPGSGIISSPDSAITTVNSIITGTYIFRWTISNGVCVQFDDVQITINASPLVTVQDHHYLICGSQQASLVASGANTYSWLPDYHLSNSGIYNPLASPDQTTTYFVTGTDLNGCTGIDSAIVEKCDVLIIPNGFSPDDDGVNDKFEITGIENYPDNILNVYNRWGNLIFKMKDYDNSWDGVPNVNGIKMGTGKVPPGTYYFVFEPAAGEVTRSGYLIIKY